MSPCAFSAVQALLAPSGATFVSPFVGRHDDNGSTHGADRGHPHDLRQL
jgi:transaldolase